MIKPTTLLKFAAYSVSMPTLAVSPALAKATVYMPSHVAAELLAPRRSAPVIAPAPVATEDTARRSA